MSHKTKVLNQTKNGFLVSCSTCKLFHLTFGHFYLEFSRDELTHFGNFLVQIDPDYWDSKYCNCTMKRKIPIPTQQLNLYLLLNRTELEELKNLVFYKDNNEDIPLIRVEHVDYDFIKN